VANALAQEGQRCQLISMGNNRYNSIIHVPENTIWVEGDNCKDSQDSYTTYGAISKKLIVGVVDRIIWPPSQIGEVPRINPPFYRPFFWLLQKICLVRQRISFFTYMYVEGAGLVEFRNSCSPCFFFHRNRTSPPIFYVKKGSRTGIPVEVLFIARTPIPQVRSSNS
jgi:hypothetical protein